MANTTEKIRQYVFQILQQAKADGYATKDIRAGDIKKEMGLGNIPRSVCDAMYSVPSFSNYDVLEAPPSGYSTSVKLRYHLDDFEVGLPSRPSVRTKEIDQHQVMRENNPQQWEHIDIKALLNHAIAFHDKLEQIPNHRYRSWEHCYTFFTKHLFATDNETIDLMCLHLSNYLASWGMFRGAAFLLQKDYKVHLEVVYAMLNERYRILRNTDIRTVNEEYINRIFELDQKIEEIYRKKTTDLENENGRNSSDTLITKILLGVFGCVPAYDRYFKSGLRSTGIASGEFSKRSIAQLLGFYERYYDEFEIVRQKISEYGVEYPPMKIIDMCFWQVGFEKDMRQPRSEQE